MLRDAWHDALILKDSREAWRELRRPLSKYDWTALLDSVSLSIDPPGVSGIGPAAKALSLFDWQDFIKAQHRATRLVG